MTTDTSNPWGLSPRQAQTMNAYCDTGCQKLAARKLGVSLKTVETHCSKAREKIGDDGRLLYVLKWDRWSQQAELRARVAHGT